MALNEGDILAGKYRIERLLGEGGMGSVYVAMNQVLQKRVALKVMSERFASVNAAVERFLREAVAASRVSHASIVQVFDAGDYEGKPWIAMELLEGESLGERLERGPLSVAEALKMADGALSALAEVHEEGIIHRDLKPDNIFLAKTRGGDWVPKVLDFGVAKDTSDGQLSKLTATGAVVGTAHYLSPEQAKGLSDIDARADVYAMGVVLFESLSGRMPYEADTITQLIAKMFTEEPRKLDEVAPHVPRAIADVITTCLDQDRQKRFQTARALLGALRSAAQSLDPQRAATAPTSLAVPAVSRGAASSGGGYQPSDPGLSGPGGYASHPGASAGGYPSHPGASAPGVQASAHSFPATAAGTPMPASRPGIGATAMMPAGAAPMPPPAEEKSGSKLPMILLVLAVFILGAGATGVGAWVVLGQEDASPAVAHSAAADTPAQAGADTTPPAPQPAPDPQAANVPTAADPPPGVDPQPGADPQPADPQPADPARAEDEERGDGPRNGRRPRAPRRGGGQDREDPAPAGTENTSNNTTQVAAPANDPPGPRQPAPLRNGLSQAQIMTAIHQRMPEIQQRCYQRRAERVPGLAGVVTLAWTVRADGRPENVQVVHNGTGDDWLGRCTRNMVADIRFPPGANGLSTPARYPFQFRP